MARVVEIDCAGELTPVGVRDADEIERGVLQHSRAPRTGGLIVTGSALASVYRDLIITLAARHKLPAVYFERHFVTAGGLISDMGPILSTSTGKPPAISIASSRAKSPPICRCRRRLRMSWSSTSRPPRHSASPCHQCCSLAPTR